MLPFLPWLYTTPKDVLVALDECAKPTLSLDELKTVCNRILPKIQNDRKVQFNIVRLKVEANDKEGVKWLFADPQRFPASYSDLVEHDTALDAAAREGHLDLLIWLATNDEAKYWGTVEVDTADGVVFEQRWVLCAPSADTLYAAVAGGNLAVVQEVASWFEAREAGIRHDIRDAKDPKRKQELQQQLGNSYIVKQDKVLTVAAVESLCEAYPPNKQQQSDHTWQQGKHFEVLQWLIDQHVGWDGRTMGAAAVAGHLELIQWLADHGAPFKPPKIDHPFVCIQAILNPDQDQAIKTLRLLLDLGAPWKPPTRGFGKQPKSEDAKCSSRSQEWAGLCEIAAQEGKFHVLKWLATAPDGLLPQCQGQKFELMQRGPTNIPLTPWEDGNEPGRIRTVAQQALHEITREDMAQELQNHLEAHPEKVWLEDKIQMVGKPAGYRNSAAAAEAVGNTEAAERYRAIAARYDAKAQEYREILAWLDSDESGYRQHVERVSALLKTLKAQLKLAPKQQSRKRGSEDAQQQQQGEHQSAAAVEGAGEQDTDAAGHKAVDDDLAAAAAAAADIDPAAAAAVDTALEL